MKVKELSKHVDERGFLTEIFRRDWDFFADEPAMAYFSYSYPGIVRAWHKHERGQTDHFVVPQGTVKVAAYDEPNDDLYTEVVGENRPAVVKVPGEIWHGFKVVSDTPALLLNLPTNLYDYDNPDEVRLEWDTDRVPLNWNAPPHE